MLRGLCLPWRFRGLHARDSLGDKEVASVVYASEMYARKFSRRDLWSGKGLKRTDIARSVNKR